MTTTPAPLSRFQLLCNYGRMFGFEVTDEMSDLDTLNAMTKREFAYYVKSLRDGAK